MLFLAHAGLVRDKGMGDENAEPTCKADCDENEPWKGEHEPRCLLQILR